MLCYIQIFEDLWLEAWEIGDEADVKALVPQGKPDSGPPESGQSHHPFLVEQMRRIYEDLQSVNYDCGRLFVVRDAKWKIKTCPPCDTRFLNSLKNKEAAVDESPAGLFPEDEYVEAESD